MTRALFQHVVAGAMGDRLPAAMLGLGALLVFVSAVVGDTAFIEQNEMTAVYAAGALRFGLIFGLVVFVALTIQRLFDSREIELLLSRPLSRSTLILGYWCGLSVLGIVLLTPFIVAITLLATQKTGAVIWGVSLWAEVLIMMGFALFAAITLERALPTVFITMGFYLLARLSGYFLGITDRVSFEAEVNASNIMQVISAVMPRLDLFSQSDWIVYGATWADALFIPALQSLIYIPLSMGVTMLDLRRKRF